MRPFTGERCGHLGGLSAWAGLGMAHSRRYDTVDFGHVERAVEGIHWRESKGPEGFYVQGGRSLSAYLSHRVVSISALVLFCKYFLNLLPSNCRLWHGWCQNSPERLSPLLKAGW